MHKAFNKNINGAETIYLNGKPIKGDWVYGDLVTIPYNANGDLEYYIIEKMNYRDTMYELHQYICDVIPETVCEAVPGLKDSEGRQIYTHDVVECRVVRCGGTYNNWCRTTNINHGKCRTLPLEICYTEHYYGCYGAYYAELTDKAKQLIEEYEKPIGNEKTRQQINWYNPNGDDLIRVIGTIFDKENNYGKDN
jgi:hypothetical protein